MKKISTLCTEGFVSVTQFWHPYMFEVLNLSYQWLRCLTKTDGKYYVDRRYCALITVGYEGGCVAIARRSPKKVYNDFCHFSIQIDLASKLIAAALWADKNYSLRSCKGNLSSWTASANVNACENIDNDTNANINLDKIVTCCSNLLPKKNK